MQIDIGADIAAELRDVAVVKAHHRLTSALKPGKQPRDRRNFEQSFTSGP
jgi:hypothetical protein